MINWYRASDYDVPRLNEPAPDTRWTDGKDYTVRQPMLVIWGEDDRVFVRGLATDLEAHVQDLTVRWVESVGHAPQREVPALCAEAISSFLETRI